MVKEIDVTDIRGRKRKTKVFTTRQEADDILDTLHGFKNKGRGWHGDTPGHRKAALKAEREGAINESIRTGGNKNMGERHHTRLDELIDSAKPTMHAMLDQALNSGALPDDFKEDDYRLAKAIITIWGRKELYAPLCQQRKKEIKNLEHFI